MLRFVSKREKMRERERKRKVYLGVIDFIMKAQS